MRLPPLSEEFPDIPVVPLIDVMFTLLTFFIVASLLIEKNKVVALKLPKAETLVTIDSKKSEQANVSVDKAGKIYLDKNPVTGDELLARLSPMPVGTVVIISGDALTEYKDIVKAMDLIRKAGKPQLALAAKPLKKVQEEAQ